MTAETQRAVLKQVLVHRSEHIAGSGRVGAQVWGERIDDLLVLRKKTLCNVPEYMLRERAGQHDLLETLQYVTCTVDQQELPRQGHSLASQLAVDRLQYVLGGLLAAVVRADIEAATNKCSSLNLFNA